MQQTSFSGKFLYTIKRIFFISVISGIFFLGLYGLNTFIRVQKIIIGGDNNIGSLRGLSSYYQKNLFILSEKDIENNLLKENPELKSATVNKKFPDSLVITVSLQPALASIELHDGYAYLSETGKIISKSREKKDQFPLIHYYQKMNYSSFSAGEDIQYIDVVSALHFLKKLSDLGLKTDTVDINGLDMLLFTIGDKKLYFTTEKDTKTQDYELEQIIRQFKVEGRDFKSLDLRFEKPIIRF